MSVQLSSGALKAINDGTQVDKPVFQLLALKKLNQSTTTNNAVDRYRILLSDGIHNNSAMLAVQLNQMVTDGNLEANTVICLERYVCNSLAGNRRVVIVLEVNVVATAAQVGGKMGNPVALPLGPSTGGSSNGQQAAAPQQPMRQPAASPMSVGKTNSFTGAGGSYNKPNYGGAGASGMSPPKQAQPISSLTPYQNRWTIKARVSNKSSIRTWSNSRGEGKLFSMDLCDQSGEIRATAFKDQCDKFFDLVEVGKVYYISRGTLKSANRQYTSITNDYEMTFNNDTTVVPCEEEDETIPTMQFDFRTVSQLENMSKDSMLDDKVVESGSSGPPAAKPVATVLPIPSPSASSTTGSQAHQAAPGQSHQITILHPVPGEGVTQQVFPGFPMVASQRFVVPGPRGTQQQVFGFPGTGPMIRVMHHQHPGPGPRAMLPNSSTAVSTGTTGTSTSSFVVHHNLVAGPRTETPASSSGSGTTSTMSRCAVHHHHHVVQGPRVVFSNAPPTTLPRNIRPGLRALLPNTSTVVSTGTTGTSTSGFVVHHNLVAGPRTETPVSSSGSATTSTMSSCAMHHHHHVVQGPRVVFSNAPPTILPRNIRPGLRALLPNTSTVVSTGTTGTSTSGFVVHHNLVAGPRTETPVSSSGSATTSTMSSCAMHHHHHVVQGPRVVFSNAPSNISSGNAMTTVAPTVVMHQQHPTTGQRQGIPATVSSTMVPSSTTATVNAGTAFQIQFQCRPGQPPTPMIRFFQNAPPGPPGTHRGMQGQQGAPVFRSPVTSTPASQTSCAETPSPAPQATPMQARPPGYQRNATAPEIELNAKPELAALAQHIRNIAADVKPTKTGNTRGGPMDQERRAAAMTSLRKKAAKAKSKAESRNTPMAETSVDNVESPSNDNELPANNDLSANNLEGPAEESAATTISGDLSRRRKKRRKRAKQQSPSSETAGQSSSSNAAANRKTDQDQGRELASEKNKTEKSFNKEVGSHREPNSAASSKSFEEDKSTDDSDDNNTSESDSELASCPISKSDDASQSMSSQSGSSGKSCQDMNKPLSISEDDMASTNDATANSDKLLDSRQDAKVDAGSLETELQTATESSKVSDASQFSLSEGAEAQSSMNPSVSQNSQALDDIGKPKIITENTEGVGLKSGQVSQPLDLPEDFKSKVTSREAAPNTNFVSHLEPNLAINHGEDVKVTDTLVPSSTEEIFLSTDAISELEVPNASLSHVQTDAKSVAQPEGNTHKDSESNDTQATDTTTEKSGSSSQTTSNFELDGVQSSNSGLKSVRPKVNPSPTASRPDENLSVKQDQSAELKQDDLDVERERLALDHKRILLEQERLLMAEDHLKTEREKLKAMQEQVQLQRDQLSLDRRRFALEQERVEVDRECLEVERHRLRTAEQRAEDSKLILSSLQEISQTLQMSVGLSFQQYGIPVSYDSDGGAGTEQHMQEQGYMQAMSVEGLPTDGATFEEQPPEEDDNEWTVVGGTRASSGHHQSMPQWIPAEGTGGSPVTADQGAQSGWPTEIPSNTLDSEELSAEYLQTLEEMTQPRASGDLSSTLQRTGRSGERSHEEQRLHEGQRLSPVHGLSTIEGRRTTTHNSSYRPSRGGRSDGRRGRNNGWKKNKKSKPVD